MSLCLNPTLERSLELQRRGVKPSNYLNKNKSKIRKIERQEKERRIYEKVVASRPVSRSNRYNHVGPRVFEYQKEAFRNDGEGQDKTPKRKFLKRGEGKGIATIRPGSAWGPRPHKTPMRATSNTRTNRPSSAPPKQILDGAKFADENPANVDGADVLVINHDSSGKENVEISENNPHSKSPVPKLNISRLKTADRLARVGEGGRAPKPFPPSANQTKPKEKATVVKGNVEFSKSSLVVRPKTAAESVGLPQVAPMEGHPLPPRAADVGSVPEYLQKRKEQWEQERRERMANMPDPNCPPGHRALTEGERLETLRMVEANFNDLMGKIARLPVMTDTLRSKLYKKELEEKIGAAEAGIKLFSRKKVYVEN